MANNKYKCEVYVCDYRYVTVSAKNAREAKKKAHDRVAKMKIGNKSIDKPITDVEEI